ncbi:MAG: hypothetical protein AAB724_03415, partial [Patescibacteria group bacterium]
MPALPPTINWFVLGREQLLSAAEIFAVLKLSKFNLAGQLLRAQTSAVAPKDLIRTLGGTVKIGEEIGNFSSEKDLLQAMVDDLKNIEGKINFGISFYLSLRGASEASDEAIPRQIENWGKEIKKILKKEGRSVRYVFKREATLSSVTVTKNGLDKRGREFMVTRISQINGKDFADSYALAKTEAVQPFEEFSRRDFGRPGRDDVSGMLPPKLAMMMINLGIYDFGFQISDLTILDPFCGSGTILTEAMLLG